MAPSRHRHYRSATKPLATAWARHLDAVMRERDLSQTNVFDLVREELGYAPTSRSAFLRIFSDKVPDARQSAALARHFGEPAADTETPAPDPSIQERAVRADEQLVATQADLAAAIRAMTSELQAMRQERAEWATRMTELEATVAVLSRQSVEGMTAQQARDVPRA